MHCKSSSDNINYKCNNIANGVIHHAADGLYHGIPYFRNVITFCSYEGRLISNAHSEISRKRYHVFKQTKVGSKVKYFIYKLTYLFFDIVALSFYTFFPT
jgi:hypothetical protein